MYHLDLSLKSIAKLTKDWAVKTSAVKIFVPPSDRSEWAAATPYQSCPVRFNRWSLGRRMLAGYGLVFAITIGGIVIGFASARQIEVQAYAMQLDVAEDMKNSSRLQGSLLKLALHEQSILKLLEIPSQQINENLRIEFSHLVEAHEQFEHDWQAIKELDEFGGAKVTYQSAPTQAEAKIANAILQDHEAAVDDYIKEFDLSLELIDSSTIEPHQIPAIRAKLIELGQSRFITELDSFIEKVTALAEADGEEQKAALDGLNRASTMQIKIVIFSILLSGSIGVLLISVLSRILLRPLQTMTRIAQQSIQESNFDLQVPVTSHDEAGVLAQTFNSYIQFVKHLLTEHQNTNQQLHTALDELHRTQGQMLQSEKMSSLGQLVAGVAHEINNPVSFIHGNLVHVQEYTKDLLNIIRLYQYHYPQPAIEIETEIDTIDLQFIQGDLPKTLCSMKIGSDRIREIVRALRNFSRLDEAELKPVDIHEGLDNTLMILQHRLKARPERPEIRIIKDYAQIPPVECYAGLLNQAFMNILVNAIDALEEEMQKQPYQQCIDKNLGRITLKTMLIEHQWVKISISDDGPGIPAETRSRIFEPFFTTKPVGKGTGMGMSISYQIITERHQGQLSCYSTMRQGTEFTIQIPLRQTLN